MEHWTIPEPLVGRFRLHIQFGGQPFWCMFDYVLTPAPLNEPVEVTLAEGADFVSQEWFPHIRRGIVRGLAEAEERVRELVGVRVEIQKVYDHLVDTTSQGCELYGQRFADDLVWRRSLPVEEHT